VAAGFTLDVHPADGDGVRVVAGGELDLAVAPEFKRRLAALLADGPVLLDLRELEFMDSSGVRVLDALTGIAEIEGHPFRVGSELQPAVRQVLEMTGMFGVLSLADGEEAS
jgi:anti-anti-sigma factor